MSGNGQDPLQRHPAPAIEVWGGVEPTYNRVGEQYFDQLARSGHRDRITDLDLFASLGIRALRYPVLWEHTAPDGPERADWRWADARVKRLRELGIRPILGLIHHGSGPHDTHLLDPAFPERLAAFARSVARRYPWAEDYTPVNEPLTTARFSALYGHWYPHKRDNRSFAIALVRQVRAIALAMRAIRETVPAARLVQTEDLGRVYSTSRLEYQAAFENERRWLSFDLLCGRVTKHHPMWEWLVWAGLDEDELRWFQDNPCPPDLFGLNVYLTSERYLDERVDRYPNEPAGSNGRDTYVDVAAARVVPEGIVGAEGLLREAWQRFGRPLAITEVHNGSTREEQLRWFDEVWQGAQHARAAGIDVRAVTAWALLGSFDWTTLVTREDGVYEPGAFDVRGPEPRPTAIAHMVRDLVLKGEHVHPVLEVAGWWRRPDRHLPGLDIDDGLHFTRANDAQEQPRPILIIGAFADLLEQFAEACNCRHLPMQAVADADRHALPALIDATRAWAVIDTGCSLAAQSADTVTMLGRPGLANDVPEAATMCAGKNVPYVAFSSDVVFRAEPGCVATEITPVTPADRVGREQARRESALLQSCNIALLVRTGPLLGCAEGFPRPPSSGTAEDEIVSPTYIRDMVNAVLDLLLDGETGIWHVANSGSIAWSELLRQVCPGTDPHKGLTNRTPRRSRALGSVRGWLLPEVEDAVRRYLAERRDDPSLPGAD